MNVVILATGIGPKNRGIGQYERCILPPLLQLLASAGCRGRVVLSRDGTLPPPPAGFSYVRLPSPRDISILRLVAEQILLPIWTRGADVFLSLESVFPISPILARRKVVVIHDLHVVRHVQDPMGFPEDYSWQYKKWGAWALWRAVKAADMIVGDSAYTVHEVQNVFHTPAERTAVVYCGVDHVRFRPRTGRSDLDAVRQRYELPDRFFLYVGPYSRKKNLLLIVEAYALAKQSGRSLPPVFVAGDTRRAPLYASTVARIEGARLSDDFRFLGTIPDEDLAPLYSMTRALIYPSLYEGFGLPPLEAMACGAPVIASERTSVPEVVGDAAVLIDPTDPGALLNALESLDDESLRANLVEKGPQRAQDFNWERSAARLADLVLREARHR